MSQDARKNDRKYCPACGQKRLNGEDEPKAEVKICSKCNDERVAEQGDALAMNEAHVPTNEDWIAARAEKLLAEMQPECEKAQERLKDFKKRIHEDANEFIKRRMKQLKISLDEEVRKQAYRKHKDNLYEVGGGNRLHGEAKQFEELVAALERALSVLRPEPAQ